MAVSSVLKNSLSGASLSSVTTEDPSTSLAASTTRQELLRQARERAGGVKAIGRSTLDSQTLLKSVAGVSLQQAVDVQGQGRGLMAKKA